MVTIGDVVRTIEECYPLSYQESYDNSGLQVGDVTQPLRGIMLAVEWVQPARIASPDPLSRA